jgi:membrane-associated phospholipid phosphatase
MPISNLDQEILLALNSLAEDHTRFIWKVVDNRLFRAFPITFPLVALWFASDDIKRRSRMLAGLLAVCLATLLSVWCQFHLNIHIRPLVDPTLPLKIVEPYWATMWDHSGSFPSDATTLFFGLSTVAFLENRLIGLFCFVWTAAIVALPRVIFGWHYPSDIIAAVILGSGSVFLFEKAPFLRMLFERLLLKFGSRTYLVHALLFTFLAEASNAFLNLEKIGKYFARMLHL